MKYIKIYKYVGGFYDCYQEFELSIDNLIKELKIGNIYIRDNLTNSTILELRLPYVRLRDILEVLKNE